ncbi:hypothetical protein WOLCODRAFT_135763, partial [Wolfiporia cocos MD-104 SS10]
VHAIALSAKQGLRYVTCSTQTKETAHDLVYQLSTFQNDSCHCIVLRPDAQCCAYRTATSAVSYLPESVGRHGLTRPAGSHVHLTFPQPL